MDGSLSIARAGLADLEDMVPLFGAYREFYKRQADPGAERTFLRDRLERAEAVVFLARLGGGVSTGSATDTEHWAGRRPDLEVRGVAAGFTLLYPTFASVSLRAAWILNDLYVAPEFRKVGVGRALMEAATRFVAGTGAVRLELRTQHTNTSAQALYESLGWKLDEQFRRYTKALP